MQKNPTKTAPVAVAKVVSGYSGDPDSWDDLDIQKLDLSQCAIGDLLYTHPQPAQQGSVPEGWKLVPVEPTTEMRYAYHEAEQRYLEGSIPSPDGQWWAMLDAAPQPPQEDE